MLIFTIEHKWKNIALLCLFFALGMYFIELNWRGGFILIAILLASYVAKSKEFDSDALYINNEELNEYSSNYYYAGYRMFLWGCYVLSAFHGSFIFTIDIAIALFWFVGYTLLFYPEFFIPQDGKLTPRGAFISTIGMIVCIGCVVGMFAWLIVYGVGFGWLSDMITDPIKLFLYKIGFIRL